MCTVILLFLNVLNISISQFWKRKYFVIYLVYTDMSVATSRNPDVDILVNFASLRSAYDATIDAMQYPQVHYILLIVIIYDN